MYRVVRMAKNTAENVIELFDSESDARAKFESLGDVAKRLQSNDGSAWVDVVKLWRRWRGRPVHQQCVENFNETMSCGIDRGQCGHEQCALR